ncbi:hypothetical protein D3C76_668690 [compost metagenome]
MKMPGYWPIKEVVVFKPVFKPLSLALLTTAFVALMGCKCRIAAASQLDAQALKVFTSEMQQTLQRSVALADTGEQIGVVLLVVNLNRQSAPTRCQVKKAPLKYDALLPYDEKPSNYQALASLVESLCWTTIYPTVPDGLYDQHGNVAVQAPIIVALPRASQASGTPRRRANAQRQFFWEHLLRDQSVSSIGTASVFYEANALGKVDGCLVQLSPYPLRTDAFRLDGHLQAELNNRCMQLDLSRMPGFVADEHGRAKGSSVVDYAPWKVGRQ